MIRKSFFLLLVGLCMASPSWSKPRIIVIATGGTIAGTGSTSVQAGYSPAQLTVDALLNNVPQLDDLATVRGLQLCNIASQRMNHKVWMQLGTTIDSLFTNDICDGVVITHGTDTMEETAYFLHLTLPHDRPIVLVGSMRPATSLSADGPMNLFNAIALAAHPQAVGKGVMVVSNDWILSADDVVKSHTVNPQAFECPNYGPLGVIRDAQPRFFREPVSRHTLHSPFSIKNMVGKEWPMVEIVSSYADASDIPFRSLLEAGVDGIVVEGVGHGNYSQLIELAMKDALAQGVAVVRSTRVFRGGVNPPVEDLCQGQICAGYKTPQKARILLSLILLFSHNTQQVQQYFWAC